MKIAIIGTHGVGKTTLAHILASYSMKKGMSTFVVSEVVRDCPFPINDESCVDGGYWIVAEQVSRELSAKANRYEVIICDRSSIDPVMYLNARDFSQPYNDLFEFANKWMQTYDIILYVKPSKEEIRGDGFRDTNKRFQEKVDEQFNLYIESIFIDYLKTNIFKVESEEIFTREIGELIKNIFGEDEWITR
jgi:thymidylate kinase